MKIRIIDPIGVVYKGQRVKKGEVIDLKDGEKHGDVWIASGQAEAVVDKKAK